MTTLVEETLARSFLEALRRPTVVFDVDGVLACYPASACEAVNGRFGTSYTPMVWWDYDGPFEPEHRKWLYAERHTDPAFWMAMAPSAAAITALAQLGEAGYVTRVWSNRPPEMTAATVAWLEHYGARARDVHLFGSAGGGKVAALGEFGPGNPAVLVDDNPARLGDAREGLWVMAPRSPYLRDASGYRFAAVFDDYARLPDLVTAAQESLWPT